MVRKRKRIGRKDKDIMLTQQELRESQRMGGVGSGPRHGASSEVGLS